MKNRINKMDDEKQECQNGNIEGLYYDKLEEVCQIRVISAKKYDKLHKKSLQLQNDIAMTKVNYEMPPLPEKQYQPIDWSRLERIDKADTGSQLDKKIEEAHNQLSELKAISKQMLSNDAHNFDFLKDVVVIDDEKTIVEMQSQK